MPPQRGNRTSWNEEDEGRYFEKAATYGQFLLHHSLPPAPSMDYISAQSFRCRLLRDYLDNQAHRLEFNSNDGDPIC